MEDHHVRSQLTQEMEEFETITGFPNDFQTIHSLEYSLKTLTEQNMIISQYNGVRGHYRVPP
jgi:hypothetical protein